MAPEAMSGRPGCCVARVFPRIPQNTSLEASLLLVWLAAVVRHVASYRQGAFCRYDLACRRYGDQSAASQPNFVVFNRETTLGLLPPQWIHRRRCSACGNPRASPQLRRHRGINRRTEASQPSAQGSLAWHCRRLLVCTCVPRRARPSLGRRPCGLGGRMGKESGRAVRRSAAGMFLPCVPGCR